MDVQYDAYAWLDGERYSYEIIKSFWLESSDFYSYKIDVCNTNAFKYGRLRARASQFNAIANILGIWKVLRFEYDPNPHKYLQ